MDDQVKPFRQWDVMEGRREIFSPEESLPQNDLVFFLLDLIPRLDLIAFYRFYSTDWRGQPPFNVPMMVTLLVYAYSVGVFSSRKIAGACERNLAFLAIVGNDCPDFRTISDFRKNHQAAMKPLFLEVLRFAGELQMVKLGNLSTDGTKVHANASRNKAMSYAYMEPELKRLQVRSTNFWRAPNARTRNRTPPWAAVAVMNCLRNSSAAKTGSPRSKRRRRVWRPKLRCVRPQNNRDVRPLRRNARPPENLAQAGRRLRSIPPRKTRRRRTSPTRKRRS